MPRSSCLTLVVPALLADASGADLPSSRSLLGRIAGRGQVVRRSTSDVREEARLQSWQRGLLAALRLDERAHPSAAVTAAGSNLDPGAKQWFHIELVHFAAGLNEVTLVPLRGATAVTMQEAAALASAIRPHLSDCGLTLHETAEECLIDSTDMADVATVTAEFARTHEWGVALPQGADAGKLRRLMTELQMLLHEHPANERRQARGIPAANAVWFWGNGRVTPTIETQRAECSGRNAFLRGVCRLHGWRHTDDATAQSLMAQCDRSQLVIGVVDACSLQELEARWLAPLVEGLGHGRFARLRLILDEWDLTIERWQLKAFWRRDRPFDSWARA